LLLLFTPNVTYTVYLHPANGPYFTQQLSAQSPCDNLCYNIYIYVFFPLHKVVDRRTTLRHHLEWKHRSDSPRGRTFLGTAPSQHVDLLTYLFVLSPTSLINHSLASPQYISSRTFFPFPHPPTPIIITLHLIFRLAPKPNPVEEDRWKGFIRPLHRLSPHGAVDVKSPASTYLVNHWVGLHITFPLAMAQTPTRGCIQQLEVVHRYWVQGAYNTEVPSSVFTK